MKNKMSTQYMLTLIADKIQDLDTLIERLKTQDEKCGYWNDSAIGNLENTLFWLKDKVEKRRSEVLAAKGINPDSYKF